jgi:hypothetical protein
MHYTHYTLPQSIRNYSNEVKPCSYIYNYEHCNKLSNGIWHEIAYNSIILTMLLRWSFYSLVAGVYFELLNSSCCMLKWIAGGSCTDAWFAIRPKSSRREFDHYGGDLTRLYEHRAKVMNEEAGVWALLLSSLLLPPLHLHRQRHQVMNIGVVGNYWSGEVWWCIWWCLGFMWWICVVPNS